MEWGVVSSLFFRFPAMVYDAAHLKALLKTDLLPVDADAWMGVVAKNDPKDPSSKLYNAPIAGNIVLLHGNGNEPDGIVAFEAWRAQHADWKLGYVRDYFSR